MRAAFIALPLFAAVFVVAALIVHHKIKSTSNLVESTNARLERRIKRWRCKAVNRLKGKEYRRKFYDTYNGGSALEQLILESEETNKFGDEQDQLERLENYNIVLWKVNNSLLAAACFCLAANLVLIIAVVK